MVEIDFVRTLVRDIQGHLDEQPSIEIPSVETKKSYDNFIAYLTLRRSISNGEKGLLTKDGTVSLNHKAILFSLLQLLDRRESEMIFEKSNPIRPTEAEKRLRLNKEMLFSGAAEYPIMVTLDKKMLNNRSIFRVLIEAGMNVVRINCAYDDPYVWEQFIGEIKTASEALGKTCKIYMDLAGPKVRLGSFDQPYFFEKKSPKNGQTKINLKQGEILRIYRDKKLIEHGNAAEKLVFTSVNLPKALYNVMLNDRVSIDDGKIEGKVSAVTERYIEVEINSTHQKIFTLTEGKGINFPDSFVYLNMPAITQKDIHDLRFIAEHADIVGVSFVHQARDLRLVKEELDFLVGGRVIPIVAKIETKDAVRALPNILREGLLLPSFGIMIARGDLAVEVGFDRIAIVQEEILTLAHAAHIPVIWATQILENLAKRGIPTRAEISDVFLGSRAQCHMLNKGKFIDEAVRTLHQVLSLIKQYKADQNTFNKRENIIFF